MFRHYSIAAVAVAFLLPAVGALAASNVSAKYDGVYSGQAVTVPAMSTGACPSFDIGPVTIAKGFLRSEKAPNQPAVNGFITEEGYLQASLVRPDGTKKPLDGRLENGIISAGLIDGVAGCAWLVELHLRAPPN
ncbi:MAG: hypothetical protein ACYCZX_08170 [Rhodospirillaceae bacterium]